MLDIGLVGIGHLGKIHLRCITQASDAYRLVGIYDVDRTRARALGKEHGVRVFDELDELLQASQVIDVVTPTPTHYEIVRRALLAGCHVFVEKPLTETLEQARELMRLADERGLYAQVGHVERFNPALLAVRDLEVRPYFIEAHRLAMFNPRGTDVSVVLDLMIHDLDIVLKLADSEVTEVRASGVAVLSHSPDIVNARIEFASGAVANLTASRVSLKNMRKVRLFQPDAYISLDLLEKESQVVRLFDSDARDVPEGGQQFPLDTPRGPRIIHVDQPESGPVNAIQLELESLAHSITHGEPPAVSLQDGYRALALADRIGRVVGEKIWLLAALLMLGCPPDIERPPAVVMLEGFELRTGPGEGAATSDIGEVWAFADGDFVGVFPLPARIPLFREGPVELRLEAGIRQDGRSVTPDIYPFYTAFTRDLTLAPGQEEALGTVEIGYRPEATFAFVEGFEPDGQRVFTQALAGGQLPRVQTEVVRSGAAAGALELGDSTVLVEIATGVGFRELGEVPINVWLEVDYRGEAPGLFGVVGLDGALPVRVFDPGFQPRAEWTKIYFFLGPIIGSADLEEFSLAFSTILPNERARAAVYLDNLKLLYLPAP